ncbi:MAG: hypothetical protein B6229_06910 [Spirochaetaceae bacterium 4572_7]|nr:MAG: hypothetical protein B6229_06910 [Spirochaetaceae bacterium 4572_7]
MIKNVIFDLGRVLISWDIETFAQSYTNDPKLQEKIINQIFNHNDWHTLDKGTITEEEAAKRFSERLNLPINKIDDIILQGRKIMLLKTDSHKELLRLKDKYNLYCISNMSHKSWEIIKGEQDFHLHFKDILISAQEKMIKPHADIFHRAIKKFDIIPGESIFIDDQQDNIDTAESLGIKGILFDESELCWKKIRQL